MPDYDEGSDDLLESAFAALKKKFRKSSAKPRFCSFKKDKILIYKDIYWSGKRDSNSRPRPWQGRALPTELFPLDQGRLFYCVTL